MSSTARAEIERFQRHPISRNKKKSVFPMAGNLKTSSSSCYSSSITHMNHDHVISILHLLPVESILSFSMTCKKFRSLASSDSLWEYICRRDWGTGAVNALLASLSSQEKRELPWKRIFQQVFQLGSLSFCRLSTKGGIFPKPRASHSLNFVSDYLVLFGGGCQGGRHLDDTWVAYLGNEVRQVVSWQQINSGTPSGRFGHTCTVVGDALILFGGINENGIRHNDTWIGHVIHDETLGIRLSWTELDLGPIAPPPRGAHAGCSVGDWKMIIHGGIGPGGLRLNDTWLLDLSAGLKSAKWHQIVAVEPSPEARSGHSLTWIGGTQMVLFGGRGKVYEVLNDVWLFDMGGESESPEWMEVICDCTSVPSGVPLPRVGHSATLVLGGRVLIFGGEDSNRHRKDDFWLLDVSSFPAVKMGCFQTMNSKRLLGKMWKKLKTEGHRTDCRSFHTACSDRSGRYVFVFGGMVDGVLHPADAYELTFDGGLHLVELVLQL